MDGLMPSCGHEVIIANTNGHSCNSESLHDEQQANAQLISAAPDMLAALETVLEWSNVGRQLENIVMAAIEKAIGDNES
jgi:hypothetical protein